MDLKINRAHARLGTRKDLESCPTAVALKCAGFEDERVWVDGEFAQIDSCFYELPGTLQNVIQAYDDGKPFKVGTYRIKGLKKPRRK